MNWHAFWTIIIAVPAGFVVLLAWLKVSMDWVAPKVGENAAMALCLSVVVLGLAVLVGLKK